MFVSTKKWKKKEKGRRKPELQRKEPTSVFEVSRERKEQLICRHRFEFIAGFFASRNAHIIGGFPQTAFPTVTFPFPFFAYTFRAITAIKCAPRNYRRKEIVLH